MKPTLSRVNNPALPKVCLLLFALLTGVALARGQSVISTASSLSNNETVATVTLNFQNTNAFPVVITDISGVLTDYGSQTVSLWYKNSAVNGVPGPIDATNGWTLNGSTSVNSYGNSTTTATQPFFQGISLTVPGNTTYGLAILGMSSVGTLRVGVLTAPITVSADGCSIHTGPAIGFGGASAPPAAPAIASRGWIGSIKFMPAASCTGSPVAAVVTGLGSICSGTAFTLSASGYTTAAGVTHQWQYYNVAAALWSDIAGATGPELVVASGITAATQYRMVSTCVASGLQGISNAFTMGIGAGLAAGTYTINKNQPASATNFVSFAAATAALGCGITGPVVLDVTPGSGPYTEMLRVGNIPGASAVNTVKINGNGNRVQYYNVYDMENLQLLRLTGAKYVKIDSLTFKTLSPLEGCGALFTGGCAYDSLTRCFFDMTSITGNTGPTGLTNSNGIMFSSSPIMAGAIGENGRNCYIGYNHVKGPAVNGGPFYGISLGYSVSDSNNVIAHNEVENFAYLGIHANSSRNVKILYNNIHRSTKVTDNYFYGINTGFYSNYLNYNMPSRVEVIGNRIHNPSAGNTFSGTFYGIGTGNGTWWSDTLHNDTIIIANNAIYNIASESAAQCWGIFLGNGNSTSHYIYHNTVAISGSAGNTGIRRGIWLNNYSPLGNDTNTVQLKNNLVTVTGGTPGTTYGFLYNYFNGAVSWNVNAQRNNFYVGAPAAGQFYGGRQSVDYPTMAAYQAAFPTQEVGSLSVDPQYLAPAAGDLTPQNISLQGNGVNLLSVVPLDINGRARSATPTPGAFEFSTDAGVTALNAPVGPFCSSLKQVKVTIANLGLNVINTVQVNWSLNGILQTPVSYSGTLAVAGNPGSTAVVTLGNGLFLPNSITELKAWTSMPNGFPDGINDNDTLVTLLQPSSSLSVNLGPDAAICTGTTYQLNAGFAGATYLWDNGAVTQTRNVATAGAYYVKVTGANGCIGMDTFQLSLRPLPLVDLGPDQAICYGTTTTLDPGNIGLAYLWDDGSTNQSRTVDTSGIYTVDVTDVFGCVGTDDVTVVLKDIPRVDGINAVYGDTATYTFNPINPLFVLNYTWNFGDGSPLKTGAVVQHRYAVNGIYTVDLMVEGECTGLIRHQSRTVDVFDAGGGTGLAVLDDPGGILVYPNPARGWLTVTVKGGLKIRSVTAMNMLGQKVYQQEADKRSSLVLPTSGLAAGIYTLKIETDQGIRSRKFEVRYP
ncbi:PKD domain-containing protein [Taibaiella chishuiensis]|uniref:Putative secreted protein (Por secretion system target) n=1 Tax=Taibaiella chishuiensis TaxID=1434707 RepID=A0A2P8CYM4_9BACT|nr:PKD domain-containing protein [Taibaiella chishuiensis]PSK90074.1 putative secreted protein (Por secretion system target) [Taibaiella chishuiensis]